jgi:hypothetical protein
MLGFFLEKIKTNEEGCEVACKYYHNLSSDRHVASYINFKFVFVNVHLLMPFNVMVTVCSY